MTCRALECTPGYGKDFADVVCWNYRGRKGDRPAIDKALLTQALELAWRRHAPAALLDSEDRWRARSESYPEEHRLLPTRLGNVLRSREDTVSNDDKVLEGLVMRRYRSIPARLMARHDEYRDRLEMYCVLVATFFAIAVGAIPLLAPCVPDKHWWLRWSSSAVACASSLALAWTCYLASIASARGYGAALAEIALLPTDAEPQQRRRARVIGRIRRAFARES